MRLIFIYGMPATGKLTVAQELEKLCGFRLFHNHLVVDLLLSTFDFGSAPFVELREGIWLSIFDQACRSGMAGLIFTFNPETTVRPSFVARVEEIVCAGGGEVSYVELVCAFDALKDRIDSPSRRQYRKLSSLGLFERLHAAGEFDTSHMPRACLTIDTGIYTPVQAATQIMDELGLKKSDPAAE